MYLQQVTHLSDSKRGVKGSRNQDKKYQKEIEILKEQFIWKCLNNNEGDPILTFLYGYD